MSACHFGRALSCSTHICITTYSNILPSKVWDPILWDNGWRPLSCVTASCWQRDSVWLMGLRLLLAVREGWLRRPATVVPNQVQGTQVGFCLCYIPLMDNPVVPYRRLTHEYWEDSILYLSFTDDLLELDSLNARGEKLGYYIEKIWTKNNKMKRWPKKGKVQKNHFRFLLNFS